MTQSYAAEIRAARAAQVKQAAEKLLRWKLPEHFNPDNGISFDKDDAEYETGSWPTGTNLFDYCDAQKLVAHLFGFDDDIGY